jgi:hypothetical protein
MDLHLISAYAEIGSAWVFGLPAQCVGLQRKHVQVLFAYQRLGSVEVPWQ